MLKFDREKYIRIAKTEGAEKALTALHRDVEKMEKTTFEGEKGWQPEDWQALHGVRDFSRELWDLAIQSKKSST